MKHPPGTVTNLSIIQEMGTNLTREIQEMETIVGIGLIEEELDPQVSVMIKQHTDKIKQLAKQLEKFSSTGDIQSLVQISETLELQIQFISKILGENSRNGKLGESLSSSLTEKTRVLMEINSSLKTLDDSSQRNQYTELITSVKEEVVFIANTLDGMKEKEGSESTSDLMDLMKTLHETVLQLENYKTEIDEEGRLTGLSISKLMEQIETIKRAKDKLESSNLETDLNQENEAAIKQTNIKTNTIIQQLTSYAQISKDPGRFKNREEINKTKNYN